MKVRISEWGLEQVNLYSNKDRYDEEIKESDIEGPFSALSHQSMISVAMLLLGDQNAGKTSLLYSLTDEAGGGVSFLHLQSLMPYILASFSNSRFCDVEAIKAQHLDPMTVCCDQLPFLDSDIARTALTITNADWQFLLQELGVDLRALPGVLLKGDFARLSLIEFGGDHIERLKRFTEEEKAAPRREGEMDDDSMCSSYEEIQTTLASSEKAADQGTRRQLSAGPIELFDTPRISDICDQSLRLFRSRNLTFAAYFINGSTATGLDAEEVRPGPLRVQPEYFEQLEENLRCLRRWCPHLCTLHVYVSRLPIVSSQASSAKCVLDSSFVDLLSSVVGQTSADQYEFDLRKTIASPLFQELSEGVNRICAKVLPSVQFAISPFLLMERGLLSSSSGSLNSSAVSVNPCAAYDILSNMLKSSLSLNRLDDNSSDSEIMLNLLRCAKTTRYFTVPDTAWVETLAWIDKKTISMGMELLEDGKVTVPETVLLPHSKRLLNSLSKTGRYGLCLKGVDSAPRVKVVCEDIIASRLLSKMRVLERCPDCVKVVVSQESSVCPKFVLEMSSVYGAGAAAGSASASVDDVTTTELLPSACVETAYRFPHSSKLCDSVFGLMGRTAEHPEGIDWDLINGELPALLAAAVAQAEEEIGRLKFSDDEFDPAKSIEPLVNAALDIVTFADTLVEVRAQAGSFCGVAIEVTPRSKASVRLFDF